MHAPPVLTRRPRIMETGIAARRTCCHPRRVTGHPVLLTCFSASVTIFSSRYLSGSVAALTER
jgi:hypothetical protein